MLNRQDLRQLKQRIAVRLAIHPLSATGVEHYIQHRWQKAGATQPHPFHPDAVARIAQCTRGIPRLVNALCDNALMLAFADGSATISTAHIVEAAGDLDLLGQPGRKTIRDAPKSAPASLERNAYAATAVNGRAHVAANATLPPTPPVPSFARPRHTAAKPSRLMRLAGKLGFSVNSDV
jgi:general secretion pathway protein A